MNHYRPIRTAHSIEQTEALCTAIATGARCAVLYDDYRLAPEHRPPAAEQDALAGADWMAQHAADLRIDATRMAVGGNSAGANLARAASPIHEFPMFRGLFRKAAQAVERIVGRLSHAFTRDTP